MEADLQRYYSVDVRDRWVKGPHRLTMRRLFTLLWHLPPESLCRGEGSAVEVRLLELISQKLEEPHPALVAYDKAHKKNLGLTLEATGSLLKDRANRYS